MKNEDDFIEDVPNDYFEDRISRLERRHNILVISIVLCGIAIILLALTM